MKIRKAFFVNEIFIIIKNQKISYTTYTNKLKSSILSYFNIIIKLLKTV